ncbi:hypothetical protein CAPTEDRAFT_167119 [Capitella teleta]|uniref:NADP-dependent oxidoreductase domain-containing protein n=1 Tax=Capitella teleta TaxID=283909 RepID=R7V1V6_CAPTE|nr:hypothetical protein CAPTEDRAFT_167119 [Capitella teleta]|eukprot:ELU12828.1 hypothetical protein CAPTEDRAFT_167119 [Capitella teleta]
MERSDLFITSKLGPKNQGRGKCREAFLKTLSDLQVSYLDLYLIHWPGAQGMKPEDDRHSELRKGSWLDMQELCREGKVRSIGVSNYTQTHLEELLSFCDIKPSVLQVEHHPHLQQNELRDFCRQHGIHFQAYSSLGTSSEDRKLLNDPAVKVIAAKHGISPAQVLLRWAVQQGIGVIPKSTHPDHIAENLNIFDVDLSPSDMIQIHALNQELHYCWNPATIT